MQSTRLVRFHPFVKRTPRHPGESLFESYCDVLLGTFAFPSQLVAWLRPLASTQPMRILSSRHHWLDETGQLLPRLLLTRIHLCVGCRNHYRLKASESNIRYGVANMRCALLSLTLLVVSSMWCCSMQGAFLAQPTGQILDKYGREMSFMIPSRSALASSI